ncbi:polyunsaturated fatty acid 5-lipoxygenase-like [Pimephales promelas]|uniref:polyunsaturated fatty acid 5-lipoxygenase-like n=1 Tax=Pimephales promelas TaxID=90988 RepID=UPI0019556CE7|nr:polyunsaturated fatty acid 5-lipoxygenase-like [Pimephales promelas]KAG1930260.1 polyunsaturated fatty acid 5-lipoxygenase [Pimephales promelas]
MFTYTVSVSTGKQEYAGTIDYVYLTLTGTERSSDRTLLDESFFQHLARGTVMPIDVSAKEKLGDIVLVKLEKENFVFNDQWYCRCISVTSPSGDRFDFPCYRWIGSENAVVLREGTAQLPQDDKTSLLKEQRRTELESRQQLFRWKEWQPGFPMSIDANSSNELPVDVQFEAEKTMDFNVNFVTAIANLGLNKLKSLFQHSWKDLADFQEIFTIIKNPVSEYVMQNWEKDFLFGYQFLNGCNPVMISKCTNLPDGFAVTQEMVKGSLDRGLTLQEELKAGNIYIVDYAILEGVRANDTDPNTQQYLAAPFCLLYKNSQNQIMPIAIQLSRQTPAGEANTVFLPSDNRHDWMLAKMWVKSSDFNVHQLVTHLLRTHLTSEVFAIAMYRQLAAVHPVYKLLIPHVRFTIAINTAAREKLISKDGIFDKANATGGTAVVEVIQKAMKTLTYKSLCFPESIRARGVEDLPNYYYRDDGMMLWDAVKSFVSDVVKICYGSDEAVQKDKEIQAFVQDVCFSGLKNCEFPESLKTREQLIEFLTVVIFTASAQHAAVNFGQYDWLSWIPNSPSTMRKPPPAQKGQVDMKYIMESLPDRGRSSWHLGATWALSQFQDNEIFLGNYPDMYFTEQPVVEATKTFHKKLAEVTKVIKSRNENLQVPYWYLSPDRIPNSVAI